VVSTLKDLEDGPLRPKNFTGEKKKKNQSCEGRGRHTPRQKKKKGRKKAIPGGKTTRRKSDKSQNPREGGTREENGDPFHSKKKKMGGKGNLREGGVCQSPKEKKDRGLYARGRDDIKKLWTRECPKVGQRENAAPRKEVPPRE